MFEKRNGVLHKNRGSLKNLTYPYMEVVGFKICQNRPYVINEWPLIDFTPLEIMKFINILEPRDTIHPYNWLAEHNVHHRMYCWWET